jgi:hypothetical protein
MSLKERLCTGHGSSKTCPRLCGEIDAWKRLPITFLIGVDQALTHIAVLSSSRLRPEAVQREVTSVKAI